MEHIQVISGDDKDDLNESIDNFVGEIINAKISFNVVHSELVVPKLMETYKQDFGEGTDLDLLNFIYKYIDNPEIEKSQAE